MSASALAPREARGRHRSAQARVRLRLAEMNLRVCDLCGATGLSDTYLSKCMTGRDRFSIRAALLIERAIGVDAYGLLKAQLREEMAMAKETLG